MRSPILDTPCESDHPGTQEEWMKDVREIHAACVRDLKSSAHRMQPEDLRHARRELGLCTQCGHEALGKSVTLQQAVAHSKYAHNVAKGVTWPMIAKYAVCDYHYELREQAAERRKEAKAKLDAKRARAAEAARQRRARRAAA